MTQEYTPTTDQVRIDYVGVDPDNVDAVTNADFIAAAMFDRWLAAHDAQIRAAALTLTDEEADIAAEAIDDADDESWYYDDKQQVIRDVLKSVASLRKGPKQ